MQRRAVAHHRGYSTCLLILLIFGLPSEKIFAADRLVGIHSAQSISQCMPWIAQEAGLFPKHNLDFQLIYIGASPLVTAVMLGGDAEVTVGGGSAFVRAYVQGATDFVFIGAVKNILTHAIMTRPEIKRIEELKGRKIGVTRIGSNSHYFTVQVIRRSALDPFRDVTYVQTGREADALTALMSGSLDAATVSPPFDALGFDKGFHAVAYGPDLKIPYAATGFGTRRPVIARRPKVLEQFMRVMAEAAKILHTDKTFTFKVLEKRLRLSDKKVMEAAYNAEIKALDPRLNIKTEAIQAILEEVAQMDSRAKKIKAHDLIDRRYLDELEKSGFFDQLWQGKRT
ncbi:MAG: ABC transporter substrate-binding protein [Deltaproteobacteria bacterium]|nr:ABC transporter substrate-binding protein [Deltaproteobacteria bacterium]